MDYKQVFAKVFAEMGMPVVIGSFDDDEAPQYPFIEYHRLARDNFDADDAAYHKTDNWQIALYSKKKEAHAHWQRTDRLEELFCQQGVKCLVSEDIFPDNGIMYTTFGLSIPR